MKHGTRESWKIRVNYKMKCYLDVRDECRSIGDERLRWTNCIADEGIRAI